MMQRYTKIDSCLYMSHNRYGYAFFGKSMGSCVFFSQETKGMQ